MASTTMSPIPLRYRLLRHIHRPLGRLGHVDCVGRVGGVPLSARCGSGLGAGDVAVRRTGGPEQTPRCSTV